MAIVKPDGMDQTEFYERAQSVCDWFSPLNPYEKKGSILKIEDTNYPIAESADGSKFEPLYCYCISAKRYALFNLGKSGEIIVRKASAHGLGQYLRPYEAYDAPKSIPAPSVPLEKIGLNRWQYDLWHEIIRAELQGHPNQVDLSYHPSLSRPAASRYGATTPALLNWFKRFNRERAYEDQGRPFNFLNSFQARLQLHLSDADQLAIPKRGRPRKQPLIKPVGPFDKDMRKAAQFAFDRETGNAVKGETLMTYAEALAQYHLRPESKFLNGDFFDRGRTQRRHVVALEILHIGKEANKWEERYFLGEVDDSEIEYGVDQSDGSLDAAIRGLCDQFGERAAAQNLGISRTAWRRALKCGIRKFVAGDARANATPDAFRGLRRWPAPSVSVTATDPNLLKIFLYRRYRALAFWLIS